MPERPNILFILSDDHGHWGMGCAGNSEIRTPNLDKLAARGTRFDSAFCASPVCSPARMSIFTGKIPSQHGVHDWLAKGHLDEAVLSKELRDAFQQPEPSWEYAWPKRQLQGDKAIRFLDGHDTFTRHLADGGYTCGLSGKWHMGDSYTPQAGFTYWKTTAMGGENYYYPVMLEGKEMTLKRGVYITDLITDNALRFLEEQKGAANPFYLSVHYTAPHAPWQREHHPAAFYDLYDGCPFASVPDVPPHPWSDLKDKTPEEMAVLRRTYLQGYFAAVTAMDAGIGRILDALEAAGQLSNTLVIFSGDNGMSMGHHGIFGKGNGTFPMNMYDSAVKVPLIWSHPGRVREGAVCEELVSHYDLFPTILEWAGLPCTPNPALPGVSFAPLLTGEKSSVRDDVVVFDEYGPVRMVRTKEWKYIHRYPYGPHELYDLVRDPGEERNLIDDPAAREVKERLIDRLNHWYAAYADPACDGKGEAVHGLGQLRRIGPASGGKPAFI